VIQTRNRYQGDNAMKLVEIKQENGESIFLHPAFISSVWASHEQTFIGTPNLPGTTADRVVTAAPTKDVVKAIDKALKWR
jgi:hypothetical protein